MIVQERFENLKLLELNSRAAQAAVRYYLLACISNPTLVPPGLGVRNIRNCREDIERTYFVRLFAEFEITLRNYWHVGRKRSSEPPVAALIDGIAAVRSVRPEVRTFAHQVREYRNLIVHGGSPTQPIAMTEAKRSLCRFLSYLPRQW